jgi:hypothetical protein
MSFIPRPCRHHGARRASVALACALLAAACGDTPQRHRESAASPIAPTPVVTQPPSPAGGAAAGSARLPATSSVLSVVSRPAVIAFPPRNESFLFRQELESMYRVELARAPTSTYVDVEGDLVWTQEYLRYRVNGCAHLDAVQKVFDQIDRGTIAPVCADVTGGAVPFPPRDESYDFRQRLEAKYRDGLRRGLSSSAVDVEGAIVWTQEYLRYRVNACDDPTSRAAVWTQIRGGPPPPVCIVVPPEPGPDYVVMGRWHGTIAMPTPRPFTMEITSRRGDTYFGSYRDIAYGSASLTVDADGRVDFFVYFGDGSGTFMGWFVAPDRVRGSMKYDKIATRFDFEMVRD